MFWSKRHKQFKERTYVHFNNLYRFAYSRLNNSEDAEDVVQETYLKAFRAFDKLQDVSNVKSWLFQILINTIRDHVRHDVRSLPTIQLDNIADSLLPEVNDLHQPGPEESLCAKEIDPQLQTALALLPDVFLAPLLLREIEGLPYKEIADVLEIPIGTVMSRLARGRDMLYKQLKDTDLAKSWLAGKMNSEAEGLPQESGEERI